MLSLTGESCYYCWGYAGLRCFFGLYAFGRNIFSGKNLCDDIFLSFPMLLCFNIMTGIIRAGGNSFIPMLIQFSGGLIKISMNVLFLLILKMGMEGAALGTVLADTAMAAAAIFCLKRNFKEISLKPEVDKEMIGEILDVGIPAGVQSVIITASNLVIQAQINSFGVDVISAFSIYIKAEAPVFYLITALGQALTAFVGQNAGAGQHQRIKGNQELPDHRQSGGGCCQLADFGVRQTGFWLFTEEERVIALGCEILSITFPFYFLYALVDIPAASMRGMEYAKVPMLLTLVNFSAVRIGMMYLFESNLHNIQGIAWCYPGSWITAAVCMMVCYLRFIRKKQQ